MKRILIDTHVWLWWMSEPKRLSPRAKKLISSADVLLSVASLWEIAIKWSRGGIELDEPPETLLPKQLALDGFKLLDIQPRHVFAVAHLPWHHRDPFDRLLVAQSGLEAIPLISSDETLDAYSLERIW